MRFTDGEKVVGDAISDVVELSNSVMLDMGCVVIDDKICLGEVSQRHENNEMGLNQV